jgi:3-hydroxyacyl-CoA dehydrogenase
MINEGAKIIDEGVVSRPHEIDMAMVNGIGFPAYIGGPLFLADQIGLPKILAAMQRYADSVGTEYWTPAPLIVRLVAEGKGFYS